MGSALSFIAELVKVPVVVALVLGVLWLIDIPEGLTKISIAGVSLEKETREKLEAIESTTKRLDAISRTMEQNFQNLDEKISSQVELLSALTSEDESDGEAPAVASVRRELLDKQRSEQSLDALAQSEQVGPQLAQQYVDTSGGTARAALSGTTGYIYIGPGSDLWLLDHDAPHDRIRSPDQIRKGASYLTDRNVHLRRSSPNWLGQKATSLGALPDRTPVEALEKPVENRFSPTYWLKVKVL